MKTYMADLGYGLTCRAYSLRQARTIRGAIGVHEFINGQWFRSVYFAVQA